ncbi:MAG: DUF1398 family protein [Alphaproteobacteria bacterium]
MTPHVKSVVEDCTAASDTNSLTFPAVVAALAAAGVEGYHADLRRAEKTYYMPDGDSHRVRCAPAKGMAADAFSAEGVNAAIRAIQAGRIRYDEFCDAIIAAGCVGYHVSLAGRRAVYYGRTGDMHVEMFPGAA